MTDLILEELLEIGQDVASLWGACCEDVEIDEEEKEVIFLCNECGEEFATSMSFNEIYEEYGLKI